MKRWRYVSRGSSIIDGASHSTEFSLMITVEVTYETGLDPCYRVKTMLGRSRIGVQRLGAEGRQYQIISLVNRGVRPLLILHPTMVVYTYSSGAGADLSVA